MQIALSYPVNHFGVRMKSLRSVLLIASFCLVAACTTPGPAQDAAITADSSGAVGQPAAAQDCEQGCKEEEGSRYQFYLGILSALIGG